MLDAAPGAPGVMDTALPGCSPRLCGGGRAPQLVRPATPWAERLQVRRPSPREPRRGRVLTWRLTWQVRLVLTMRLKPGKQITVPRSEVASDRAPDATAQRPSPHGRCGRCC